ncbi:transposase [Thiomonas sp. CB3]|nr:transposase [Thiomonas sp. CB3]
MRPAECGRGNRAGGSRSYRLRLREHLGPELRRQVAGSQQIDVNAEQRFQFFFQIAQVQQRGTGQRIDQQVEVAAIPVGAMQHRAEDARVRGAKAAYRFTHCASLHVKHNRRSHGHPFLSKLVEMICNQE